MGFFRNLLGLRPQSSAQKAKGRLISVLIHDRTDISPQLLESLRVEMIALLKKYMEIDESNIDINLDRGSREVELAVNVPVLRVKRGTVDLSEDMYSPRTEGSEARQAEPPRTESQRHSRNRRRR